MFFFSSPNTQFLLIVKNIIRKSFYRAKFYSKISDSQFNFHKNHCFDFLRQAIQCHGDVSMTYWWNKNYTRIMPDHTLGYSDWYLNANETERLSGAFINWDIEHSCRVSLELFLILLRIRLGPLFTVLILIQLGR